MTVRPTVAFALLFAACGGDSATTPTPGTLSLRLSTPNGNDGAMVVVVSGGAITAVNAAAGLEVVPQVDGAGTHLLVVGDIAAGVIATIDVPDISRASAYAVTIEQVADRLTFALLDAAPYRITITPTP